MSLETLAPLILAYRYEILVPLVFAEGPMVSLAAGFFASLGYFNLWFLFPLFVGRDIIVDSMFYFAARFGNRSNRIERVSSRIGITPHDWHLIEKLWARHPGRAVFMAKLAYGLSATFLASAGVVGLPYRRFLGYAAVVSFIEYALLLTLGYYFGATAYARIAQSFTLLQIVVLALVLVIALWYLASRVMRRRLAHTVRMQSRRA